MIVGITGSIACGKSKVLEYLKALGHKVISLDEICHNLLDDSDINKKVKEALGIEKEGNASRKEIGEIVFGDKEKLEVLNNILHPLALDIMNLEIRVAKKMNGNLFVEVPLLYELKMNTYFDKVWFIYVNQETQLKRLMERNNISVEEALKRINSQICVERKMQMAIFYGDYIIDNNGELVYTYKRINDFLMEM